MENAFLKMFLCFENTCETMPNHNSPKTDQANAKTNKTFRQSFKHNILSFKCLFQNSIKQKKSNHFRNRGTCGGRRCAGAHMHAPTYIIIRVCIIFHEIYTVVNLCNFGDLHNSMQLCMNRYGHIYVYVLP